MRYYFAPMEGITDSVYRRVHHKHFGGVDAYYMPFLSPTQHRVLTHREARELPRADSVPFRAVPQVLTKVAEDFCWAARQCLDQGYDEVNLNVGCPSGTVTAKGKGAGMLRDPEGLDRFLDAVFAQQVLPISVKTRLGFSSAEEFPKLLEIFDRYPIRELTIHPRVRTAFYQGSVDLDAFAYAVENSQLPLCYNGNLTTAAQIGQIQSRFPEVQSVMLGRGLVGNPAMLDGQAVTGKRLEAFHDELVEEYCAAFGGARNAMFRMKENWHHMIFMFEDHDRLWKKLRKTTDIAEYRSLTHEIFTTLRVFDRLHADW